MKILIVTLLHCYKVTICLSYVSTVCFKGDSYFKEVFLIK